MTSMHSRIHRLRICSCNPIRGATEPRYVSHATQLRLQLIAWISQILSHQFKTSRQTFSLAASFMPSRPLCVFNLQLAALRYQEEGLLSVQTHRMRLLVSYHCPAQVPPCHPPFKQIGCPHSPRRQALCTVQAGARRWLERRISHQRPRRPPGLNSSHSFSDRHYADPFRSHKPQQCAAPHQRKYS